MEFGLSEEQRLLEDSVLRYLREQVPMSRVRRAAKREDGLDDGIWSELAELGAVGALVPEDYGGSGLTLLDAALIARALGYGATPVPFLGTSVLAVLALDAAGSPTQKSEWLPKIATGSMRIGVALGEGVSRPGASGVRRDGDRLIGRAGFAIDAAGADAFLVATQDATLHLVPKDASGLEVQSLITIDRTRRVAELGFDAVQACEMLAEPPGGAVTIERLLAAGRIVLAADALGACDRSLEMAVSYAKTRKQFGRVIGSFQAVKHLLAEMAAEIEPTRSLLWYAAHSFDASPHETPALACLTKSSLTDIATRVVRSATEVHGGIGFTDEHDLQLWFKRAGLDRQLLGGPTQLRLRAAEQQGLIG